jgi:hypothetical protein
MASTGFLETPEIGPLLDLKNSRDMDSIQDLGNRIDMASTGLGLQKRYDLYWTWETAEIWPLLDSGNSRDMASTRLGKQQRYGLYWNLEALKIWPLLGLGNSRDMASTGLGK